MTAPAGGEIMSCAACGRGGAEHTQLVSAAVGEGWWVEERRTECSPDDGLESGTFAGKRRGAELMMKQQQWWREKKPGWAGLLEDGWRSVLY